MPGRWDTDEGVRGSTGMDEASEEEDRHGYLLRALVDLSMPVDGTTAELAQWFDWDGAPLVELSVSDMVRVLHRFLDGELSPDQLEGWADAIEGRSDIALQDGAEAQLKQLLFEISTPAINFAITPPQASEWRKQLTAKL